MPGVAPPVAAMPSVPTDVTAVLNVSSANPPAVAVLPPTAPAKL